MNYKTLIKIVALALAMISALAFASCGKKPNGGEMTEQSGESKGETDNIKDNKDIEFTGGYYNWIYSKAFNGFPASIKVTKLPKEIEDIVASLKEEKKVSQLRDIFCSQEVVAAIQTASEYELKKSKYTHDVVSVKKNSKGIYSMTMKFTTGTTVSEKIFELMMDENKRAVKLTCYDSDGKELYYHEIVTVSGGYIAVNRASENNGKWTALQLLFKAEGTAEGYCALFSDLAEAPASVYKVSLYSGFAGKN